MREKFDSNFCYRCNTVRQDGHVCRLDGVIPRSPGEARTPGWRTRGLSPKMKFAVTSTPRLDAMRVALDLAKAAHEASPRDEELKQAWLEADHEHHLAFCAAQGKWEWIDGLAVWVALDGAEQPAVPTSTAAARGMADRGEASQRASAAAVASVSGSSVYTSPAYMNSWARWVATADDPVDPFPPYRSSARSPVQPAPVRPAPSVQADLVEPVESVKVEPVLEVEPVRDAERVKADRVVVEPAWTDTPGVSRRVAALARRVVAGVSRRLLEVV